MGVSTKSKVIVALLGLVLFMIRGKVKEKIAEHKLG